MINAKELLQLNESFSTEDSYRSSRAVSYSTLKDINNDPNVLVKKKDDSKKMYLDLGTIVDVLLTEPKNFDDKVFISKYPLPSESIQKIVNIIVHKLKKNIADITVEDAIDLFKQVDSNVKWLPNTKLKKILEDGKLHYLTVKQADGRTIISKDLLQKAKILAVRTKTYPWTRKYFQTRNTITQYKMKVKYGDVFVKAMLDILDIDDKEQTITPIDVKTGSLHPKAFMINFNKYKYYYQGGLYRKVLTDFIYTNIKELSEYKICPFKFIFISTINFLYPTIWNITDEKHNNILNGYNDVYGNTIKGINELINDVSIYNKQIKDSPYDPLVPTDLQKTDGQIDINI